MCMGEINLKLETMNCEFWRLEFIYMNRIASIVIMQVKNDAFFFAFENISKNG